MKILRSNKYIRVNINETESKYGIKINTEMKGNHQIQDDILLPTSNSF